MAENHRGNEIDYGKCPCTGAYEHRLIEVELTVAQRSVVLTDIPQGECAQCSSQVYKMQVMERLEGLMRTE
ncbi:hypothetical protein DRW03_20340 [Corallococcus sp. H22C18031201]|uniref:hypothetical protein n=1 Tax=Citreicoccus inhibens TaxID=2849499 RepID=UPI000E77185E|nr:hypothetical protein [Citreicoccus inhibens]MBJ6760459.1 hypothetical protein [Myxococcaceae bacterium JPH2]MBU8895685.1 hypothetical protein [Citreicoccus inhibens]RJS20112.1 hypothetical protein DRW03_20340 [Corallococcus sp. H22C18031201]